MSTETNLLFGVMALHGNFIKADQFASAAADWSLKKDRSIGEILVERSWIDEELRQLIEQLVEKHVKAHGGDAQKSLLAFHGAEESLRPLGLIQDSNIQNSLRALEVPTSDSESVEKDSETGLYPRAPGRYTLKEEIGRGGLGRVLVAMDNEMHRQVAVKELLPGGNQPAGTPVRLAGDQVARFLSEARITGNLEHPSIVPVYEIGQREDGSLYYTMKIVRGRSLADTLKGRTRPTPTEEQETEAPSEENAPIDLIERLKLLPHFVDICQAIAYAHSQKVIHRDLKPDNIMLGQFGETVVIDWGLAKIRGQKDVRSDDLAEGIRKLKEGIQHHTVDDQAIGTPAYMPPEQADGRIEDIDERSDVFSLGAILYELLTGHPPYQDKTLLGTVALAAKGAIEPVETLAPDAPLELAAICQKALHKSPEERFQTAKALAEEVQRYLSGQFVSVYTYSLTEHLKRWAKKYKAPLAVAVLAMVLLIGVAGYGYVENQKARQTAEENAVRADVEAKKAEERRIEAEEFRGLAEQRAKEAKQEAEKALLAEKEAKAQKAEAVKFRNLAEEQTKEAKTEAEKARQAEKMATLARTQAEDLINYMLFNLRDKLRPIGKLDLLYGVATKAKKYFESLDLVQMTDAGKRNLSVALSNVGDVLRAQGDIKEALVSYRKHLEIMKSLAKKKPRNTDWQRDLTVSYENIGDALVKAGKREEALASYRKSLEIMKSLTKKDPLNAAWQRDLSVTYDRLGYILMTVSKPEEALASYRKSLEMRESLVKLDPGNAGWQRDLSIIYDRLGDVLMAASKGKEALTFYRKGLEIRKILAKKDPRNTGWQRDLTLSYDRLGAVLLTAGKREEALALQRKSLEIREFLVKLDPRNAGWQRDLSASLIGLGDVLVAVDKREEALPSYRKSLEIREFLAKKDPGNAEWQRDLFLCLIKLGDVLVATDKREEALDSFRKSLKIMESLVKKAPRNAGWKRDLTVSYDRLGALLASMGQLEAALDSFRKNLKVIETLAKKAPRNESWQRDLTVIYDRIGDVLVATNKLEEALASYRKSLKIRESLAMKDIRNAGKLRALIVSFNKIGEVLMKAGKLEEAMASFQKSLKINKILTK